MSNEVITIEGKITNINYISKWKSNFTQLDIDIAQGSTPKKNVFIYKYNNEEVAISVWTSPKRTKTNPLPRVYNTLSHDGIKITIIPVLKEEGESGEQNMLHANTIYWMSVFGVYVIVGYYENAILGKVGKQAANAKKGKPSKEGNPKFAEQILELGSIKAQIHKIIDEKPDLKSWNTKQIKKIPALLDVAITTYRELSRKLRVPIRIKSLNNKELFNKKWKSDLKNLFLDHTKLELEAQNREIKTTHSHEDILQEYGDKAKFNIDCGNSEMLYLTADAVNMNNQEKIITITEAKNTVKDDYPNIDNIKDDLMKLALFKKTNFEISGIKYAKKLRCCLKGKGNSNGFRDNFSELIKECNTNDIELRFNNEIIT